jgi:UPF0755 protein
MSRYSSAIRPLVIASVVVGVGILVWWGATGLAEWASGLGGGGPEIVAGNEVTVEIPVGSTARTIGAELEAAGVVGANDFEDAVSERGVAAELQAGTYTFITGTGVDVIIDALIAGPLVETYWVTIPEGLRATEIVDLLAKDTPHDREALERALLGGVVTSSLVPDGGTELVSWEGMLFPDTYEFAADAGPADILSLLASTMEQRVAALDWSDVEEAGLTVYDGIVIASLVEAEAAVDGDRPLISSVVENRLELGMQLQIDATVLYALDRRGGSVTLDDLEVDSPYNTYANTGLPPTPIGAPGRASLEAAAAPEQTDYLYYVLTSEDGTHSFTADYDEFLDLKQQAKDDGVIP